MMAKHGYLAVQIDVPEEAPLVKGVFDGVEVDFS